MRKILALLLLLPSFIIYAQDWSEINADLGISDSLINQREIRIYRSLNTTNYTSLFRMYETEPDAWTAVHYEHWATVEGVVEMKTEKTVLTSKHNMEYVYLNFLRSYILDLPDHDEIDWKLMERGKIELVERVTRRDEKPIKEWDLMRRLSVVMDGTGYYFQAKNPRKYNEFAFSNPFFYRDQYPKIDEPHYVCEIINIIRDEFGIWNE